VAGSDLQIRGLDALFCASAPVTGSDLQM